MKIIRNIRSFYCIKRCHHSFYVSRRDSARGLYCEPGNIYQFDVSNRSDQLMYVIFDSGDYGTSHDEEDFNRHFIDLKELRRLKLLKINESKV